MRRLPFTRLLPLLLCCGLPAGLRAGSVRYFSGETVEGKLELTARGLVLTAKAGPGAPVDLASVLEIAFHRERPLPAGYPAGAVLTDGSALAESTLPALEGTSATIGREGFTVPATALAWLLFTPLPREQVEGAHGGQTGGVLAHDDFFPGTFLGHRGGRVSLNSTLFGPQQFAAKSQLTAVVLRDVKPAPVRYLITTTHGSRLLSDEVTPAEGALLVKEALLGPVRLKADELAELRAGSGRYQWLAELAPDRITPAAGGQAAAAFSARKAPPDEEGASAATGFSTAANAAVTWTLPPGFSTFTATVSLPAETANARATFAVYGDGRLLFRTPALAPADKPTPLRVELRGSKTLTLRAESAGLSNGIAGEWNTALLLR